MLWAYTAQKRAPELILGLFQVFWMDFRCNDPQSRGLRSHCRTICIINKSVYLLRTHDAAERCEGDLGRGKLTIF